MTAIIDNPCAMPFSGCYDGYHRKRDSAQCRGDLFGCYGGGSSFSGCYGGHPSQTQHRYKAAIAAGAASPTALTRVEPIAMAAAYNGAGCGYKGHRSQTAWNAFAGATSRMTGAKASKSGKFIILEISSDSAFDTSRYGYATLSDGKSAYWRIIRVSTPTLSSLRRSPHTSKTIPKVMTGLTISLAVDDWNGLFFVTHYLPNA